MKTEIWFPFYYGDYLKDTMQLSAERHGVYLLLMIHCWQHGGFSDDIDEISTIARVQEENKSLSYILKKYFVLENGEYKNGRINKEREKAEARKEMAKINGSKGGRPKKKTETEPIGYLNKTQGLQKEEPKQEDNQNISESSSSSSSSSSSYTTTEPPTEEEPPKPPRGKGRLQCDFIDGPEMREVFQLWSDNKPKPFKNKTTAEIGYKSLLEMSGGNVQTAKKIVDQSLGNGWQGLFELKGNQNPSKPDQYKMEANFEFGTTEEA